MTNKGPRSEKQEGQVSVLGEQKRLEGLTETPPPQAELVSGTAELNWEPGAFDDCDASSSEDWTRTTGTRLVRAEGQEGKLPSLG